MSSSYLTTLSVIKTRLFHRLTKYFIVLAIALLSVFYDTFVWIMSTWYTYTISHGPVIFGASLYMIWTKRHQILNLLVRPNYLSGTAVTVIGCVMLISGKLSSILLLQYLSVIVVILGLVLLIWGYNYFKYLWYPIGYNIFMFPVFTDLLGIISVHLQNIAAWIAYNLLMLIGIPVLRTSQFIELPNITLEVAKECNGINHIIALMAIAVPLAYWMQKTFLRRFIIIFSAFFIGIFANGLRVALIGALAFYKKDSSLHGPYDIFYVSFIFFFGLVLLMAISLLLKRIPAKSEYRNQISENHALSLHTRQTSHIALLFAAFLLFMTSGYLLFLKPRPVYLQMPIETFPKTVNKWTGQDTLFSELPFKYFLADIELKRIYRNNYGNEIKLYIGYFPIQDQGKEIVNYRFDPLQEGSNIVQIPTSRGMLRIKKRTNISEATYFWYDINGRIITDRYTAKLTSTFDAFMSRRTNAAIVVVSAQRRHNANIEDDRFDIEFIKNIFPITQTFLNSQTM